MSVPSPEELPTSPEVPLAPKRRRRWPWVLGGIVLTLVFLVMGAFLYLRTAAGGELLKAQVLRAASAALRGKLELGEVRLWGAFATLTEVKLFTPEGELVAHIERVQARVELWALTRGEVRLDEVQLDGPHLYLKTDDRGLNLSRALASRSGTIPAEKSESAGVRFGVRSLALRRGSFELQTGNEPTRQLDFDELMADGQVVGSTAPLQLEGTLKLSGQSRAPLAAPLSIDIAMRNQSSNSTLGNVALQWGGSRLQARVGLPALEIDIEALEIAEAMRRAWGIEFEDDAPWRLKGLLSLKRAELSAQAAGAKASLTASYSLEPMKVDLFLLKVDELSARLFSKGLAPSTVSLKVEGALADVSNALVTGNATASASWKGPNGAQWADAQLKLTAQGGAVDIPALTARVFGSKLEANGRGDVRNVAVKGTWTIASAAALSRGLTHALSLEPVSTSGSGRLDLSLDGTWSAPKVSGRGRFESLSFPGVKLIGLVVDARVPNLGRPYEAGGELTLARLDLGEQHLEAIDAKVSTWGRKLEAKLTAKGLSQIALNLTGTLGTDARSMVVSAMSLSYPQAQWSLLAPVEMKWSEGRFQSEHLTLVADRQRLSWVGGWTPKALDGKVRVEALNLSRLPALLGTGGLKLKGEVGLSAKLSGTVKAPGVDAQLDWKAGGIYGVDDITLASKAIYARGKLSGSLKAETSAGAVEGAWNLPLTAWRRNEKEPLSLDVKVKDVATKKLIELSGAKVVVQGAVSGRVTVSGDTQAPLAMVELESSTLDFAPNASAPHVVVEKAVVKLQSDERAQVAGQFDVQLLGGGVKVTLHSGGLAKSLREGLPSVEEWRRMPLTVSWNIEGLESQKVFRAADVAGEFAGLLSSRGKVTGNIAEPAVDASFAWTGLKTPPLRVHDLAVTVQTTREQSVLKLTLSQEGQIAGLADVTVGAGLDKWARLDELGAAALKVEVKAGPLSLPKTLELTNGRTKTWLAQGLLRLGVSASGTLATPQWKARASVEAHGAGKVSLGQWNASWDYAGKTHTASVAMFSPRAGALNAKAQAELEVGLASVRRGLAWASAPFDASLEVKSFDIAFLSGVHESLRTVGGIIEGQGVARGTAKDPWVEADLAISKGQLGLAGLGEYKEIGAKFHVDPQRVTLQRLNAVSGAGTVALKGEGTRVKAGHWALQASGETVQFPIVVEDQTVASATAQLKVAGEYTGGWLNLREVTVAKARVDLPATKRKDLQSLDQREDIVIVRAGEDLAQVKRERAERKAAGGPFKLAMAVSLPDGVQVRASDLQVDADLSDGFRVEYQNSPLIYGSVTVRKGYVDVFGRRLDVSRDSRITFAGDPKKPFLNLIAQWVNEREGVTVYVTVKSQGQLDKISLKTRSDPPLSEGEIYTLLATGRRNLKRGSGAAMTGEQAVSSVAGVVAAQLKTALMSKLPIQIDVLSVDSGEKGFGDWRVEAGKYLSDDFYVGYLFQAGADPRRGQNTHTARVEYQWTKRISVEAFGGSERSAGAELVWSYEY
jgi:translocation and assembly module TamB